MGKSRVNFQYTTEDNDAEKAFELPLRLLVLADLAKGQSADAGKAFEDREKRKLEPGGLDRLMKDMDISLQLNDVANHLRPAEGQLSVSIPLRGMDGFRPENVARNVPQLAAMLKKRELLQDFLDKVKTNPKKYEPLLKELGLQSGKAGS